MPDASLVQPQRLMPTIVACSLQSMGLMALQVVMCCGPAIKIGVDQPWLDTIHGLMPAVV